MAASHPVVGDDRLLIEELLVGLGDSSDASLHTTSFWYHRACRAAVVGAGGHLSGPSALLDQDGQSPAATGLVLNATIWISVEAAAGVLPNVLDAEDIAWRTVDVD